MDVASGNAKLDEAAFSMGKKALSAAVSYGTGAALSAVQPGAAVGGFGAVAAKTALAGAKAGSDLAANSALAALGYVSGEGLSFDSKAFASNLFSAESLVKLTSGMGQAAASEGFAVYSLSKITGFSKETYLI